MGVDPNSYDTWLTQVREALDSINMPMEGCQAKWPFDFKQEFATGVSPNDAASKANRFWRQRQNKAIGQDCRRTANCWLANNHRASSDLNANSF